MKTVALLFLFLLPIQWEPSFEHAKVLASEKNELILLNFSGSDWCVPCISLRKDFLESEAFTDFAAENLILVNADFPRKKKSQGDPAQIKRNASLAEQYNPNGIFPRTLLLNAEGKVLKTWEGKPKGSVDEWIAELKVVCQATK